MCALSWRRRRAAGVPRREPCHIPGVNHATFQTWGKPDGCSQMGVVVGHQARRGPAPATGGGGAPTCRGLGNRRGDGGTAYPPAGGAAGRDTSRISLGSVPTGGWAGDRRNLRGRGSAEVSRAAHAGRCSQRYAGPCAPRAAIPPCPSSPIQAQHLEASGERSGHCLHQPLSAAAQPQRGAPSKALVPPQCGGCSRLQVRGGPPAGASTHANLLATRRRWRRAPRRAPRPSSSVHRACRGRAQPPNAVSERWALGRLLLNPLPLPPPSPHRSRPRGRLGSDPQP